MKTDWEKVNAARVRSGEYATADLDGFNGKFLFRLNGLPLEVIASDGLGWDHVSVTLLNSNLPPSWSVMCQIKRLFWGDDEWVVQFHPPKDQYVDNHPGCLHLWRCTSASQPTPRKEMV